MEGASKLKMVKKIKQVYTEAALQNNFSYINSRLEKTCFQRGYEFFKDILFIKKNVEGASKLKMVKKIKQVYTEAALQRCSNQISAWVFSCKFAVYFQKSVS